MILRSENKKEVFLGLALVVFGIAARLLPHPENFAPVAAIALFSGVALPPSIALTAPLLIMIATDPWIGHHELFWLIWGSFFLVSLLGVRIGRAQARWKHVFFGTAAGSILFFVLTNLGVFFFQNMYSKDWAGFWQCFMMALPFFRNSLLGDLFYSGVLFGAFALAKSYMHRQKAGIF